MVLRELGEGGRDCRGERTARRVFGGRRPQRGLGPATREPASAPRETPPFGRQRVFSDRRRRRRERPAETHRVLAPPRACFLPADARPRALAPLKFTFHVPAWTPSPASMRSPTTRVEGPGPELVLLDVVGRAREEDLVADARRADVGAATAAFPHAMASTRRLRSSLSLMDAAPAPAKCAMTRSPFFSMLIFRSQPGWSWSA